MDNDNIIILPTPEETKKQKLSQALEKPGTAGKKETRTDLVVKSTGLLARPRSFQHLWMSFVHAFRWSQLKRHFTLAALKSGAKKHWFSTTAVVLIAVIFFRYSDQIPQVFEQPQPGYTGQQASIGAYPEMMHVQEEQKPGTPDEEKASTSDEKEEIREEEKNTLDQVSIPAASSKPPVETVTELPVKAGDDREDYINRFIGVARGEMKKYKIPASVILGTAVLASDFGTNAIATEGNNHLGVSCQNNLLHKEAKSQVTHDGACFTHFKTSWASFRANSLLLSQGSYKELGKVAGKDYVAWASGLDKIGYNVPNFTAEALIATIEKYELNKLDEE